MKPQKLISAFLISLIVISTFASGIAIQNVNAASENCETSTVGEFLYWITAGFYQPSCNTYDTDEYREAWKEQNKLEDEQTVTDLKAMAASQYEQQKAFLDTRSNYLQDSKTVVWSKAEAELMTQIEENASREKAVNESVDVIEDYYARQEIQVAESWDSAITSAEYIELVAENESGIDPKIVNFNPQTDWKNNTEIHTLHLVNGSTHQNKAWKQSNREVSGNVSTGELRGKIIEWQKNIGENGGNQIEIGPNGNIVYYANGGTSNGALKAIDAETHNDLWGHGTSTAKHGSIAISSNNETVYFSAGGNLTAHNPKDGSVKWYNTSVSGHSTTIALTDDNDYLYTYGGNGDLEKWDTNTGKLVWSTTVSGVDSTYNGGDVEVIGTEVFLTYHYDGLSMEIGKFDPSDGSTIWTNSGWLSHWSASNQITTYNGSLWVQTKQLDKSNGDIIKEITWESDRLPSNTMNENYIVLVEQDGEIRFYDRTSLEHKYSTFVDNTEYVNDGKISENGSTYVIEGGDSNNNNDGHIWNINSGAKNLTQIQVDGETIVKFEPYGNAYSNINDTSTQVVDNWKPYANEVYNETKAGNISKEDWLSANTLAQEYAQKYNETGYYAYAYAYMALAGLETPNLNKTGSMTVEYWSKDGTHFTAKGLLFSQNAPTYPPQEERENGTWYTGINYSTDNIEGSQMFIIEESRAFETLNGTFKILEMTDKEGESISSTTTVEYNYQTYNSSEWEDKQDNYTELRNWLESQEPTLSATLSSDSIGGLIDNFISGLSNWWNNTFGSSPFGLGIPSWLWGVAGAFIVLFLLFGRQ